MSERNRREQSSSEVTTTVEFGNYTNAAALVQEFNASNRVNGELKSFETKPDVTFSNGVSTDPVSGIVCSRSYVYSDFSVAEVRTLENKFRPTLVGRYINIVTAYSPLGRALRYAYYDNAPLVSRAPQQNS